MRGFNEDGLIYSEGYADTLTREALPYIEQHRTNMTVDGYAQRPLFASRFDADAPRGTVLIVHGFTENVEKFTEIIHSLLRNNLSVVAYDQRGHGRSWRAEGLADISLTHVDHFDEYVEDMAAICRRVLRGMPEPHRVLCHSMGGAVTGLFLERHPAVFDRAAMSSPMIAPDLKGLPKSAVRLMCSANKAMGKGAARLVGAKPYSYPDDFNTAPATGRARFDWYETVRRDHAALSNNSPSFGWTLEAVNVTDRLLAPGAVENITAKVRLYTAALDETVLPAPQKAFINRVKDGEHIIVEGAKHEIYRSTDEVLFPWWKGVLSFLLG